MRIWSELTPDARRTFVASYLGWTLDAFDFFLLTFVVTRIAADFHRAIAEVAAAITLTLALRPLGALIFGWLGDRYGRRLPLMIDVAFFSLVELLTAFSPNFIVFLILRALYGVAMGGEWGLGAAMAMETLPPNRRGLFSGILQQGYACGYLLAAIAYFLVAHFTHQAGLAQWDWRILFLIGTLPALLVFYIRRSVPESPVWLSGRAARMALPPQFLLQSFTRHWPLFIYAIAMMAAMNFMSHGTQDLYPTFLQKQLGFGPGTVSLLAIIANVGAICGGVTLGALSQRFGRRACMLFAALIGACFVPLWAFSSTIAMLALGAFLLQFAVQGAWGIIPAHLNELSPDDARATFPGFTYQLGNLISAGAAQMEAAFAATHFKLATGGANYAGAMSTVAWIVFAAVFVLVAIGYAVKRENRELSFARP